MTSHVSQSDAIEHILSRWHRRSPIDSGMLSFLAGHGPAESAAIADAAQVDRRGMGSRLHSLQIVGLIDRAGPGWKITELGRAVLPRVLEFDARRREEWGL